MTEEIYEELSLFDFEDIKQKKVQSQKGIDEKMYAVLLGNFIGANSDKIYEYVEKYSIDDIFSLPDRFQIECELSRSQNEQIRTLNKMNKLHKQLATNNERYQITSSEAAINYCSNLFSDATEQEDVYVVCLDTKNKVIAADHCFRGGLNSSIASPREIMSKAVANRAARFIICHNHPSGDSEPSPPDITFTNRMKEAGELMGIELLDHIIIGENSVESSINNSKVKGNHFSFKENGVLEDKLDYMVESIAEGEKGYSAVELPSILRNDYER